MEECVQLFNGGYNMKAQCVKMDLNTKSLLKQKTIKTLKVKPQVLKITLNESCRGNFFVNESWSP